MKELRKMNASEVNFFLIFGDFWGPQGASKIVKNQKKGFQKSITKRAKKRGYTTS